LRTTARYSVAAGLLTLLITACNSGPDSPLSPSDVDSLNINSLVSSLSVGSVPGASVGGQPPTPGGGPTISVAGNQTVVNGGTLNVAISSGAPFQTVYMFAGSSSLGLNADLPGGIDGYYQVQLPSSQASATALLTFPQSVPLNQFELLFAVADPSGVVGPFARLSTNVTEVGTGDIQVTLSWDVDSDVDLHVLDPRGDEVYYGNLQVASGGQLDLDSNAGCAIDGVRNENITWPVGRAPRGQYTVRVDYWSSCGVAQTNYTVRINNGGSVQLSSGSFTGGGDTGGRGSGRFIATFERLTGPTATSMSNLPAAFFSAPSSTKGKTLVSPRQ
jgi:uncharacterized protein YfaP (DUF2135 family)